MLPLALRKTSLLHSIRNKKITKQGILSMHEVCNANYIREQIYFSCIYQNISCKKFK